MSEEKEGLVDTTGNYGNEEFPMEFEVLAQAKNEIILGHTGEFVLGDELVAVFGLTEYIHIINLFELVIGGKEDFFWGGLWELGTEHNKAKLREQKLEASYSAIFGEGTNISAAQQQIHANRTAINVLRNDVDATARGVQGQGQQISALESICTAEKMQTIANNTAAIASAIRTVASSVDTVANDVELASTKTTMNTLGTNTAQMRTLLDGLTTIA